MLTNQGERAADVWRVQYANVQRRPLAELAEQEHADILLLQVGLRAPLHTQALR